MILNSAYSLCLFLAAINLSSAAFEYSYSDGQEFFLGFPTPRITRGPINIDTSKVHDLILPPLILLRVKYALMKLENTGEALTVTLVLPSTLGAAFGGPLGSAKYEFVQFAYYWSDNLNETSSESLDGEKFPLVAIAQFRNRKYPTMSEAVKHRDGFVEVADPFRICSTPNSKFNGLGDKLKEIRQPGSSTFAFLGTLINAVDFIPINGVYYTYPGGLPDPVTGKIYYCVTTIFPEPNDKRCITKEQFTSTFGSLRNTQGGRLMNIVKRQPDVMPVVRAKYVIQPELLFY